MLQKSHHSRKHDFLFSKIITRWGNNRGEIYPFLHIEAITFHDAKVTAPEKQHSLVPPLLNRCKIKKMRGRKGVPDQ